MSAPGRSEATLAKVDPPRPPDTPADAGGLKALIRAEAAAAGFATVGFTSPDAIPLAAGRLQAFLAAGQHGDMDWMAETADRRGDPARLWGEARAVVMLGLNYGPDSDPLAALADRRRAAISVYAQGRDYHDIVKSGLKRVARFIAAQTKAPVKVFVDTAPLMEKPLAAAAGLGWQGRHTNLVSRVHGSWLFLGAILTAAQFEPDPPEVDHCGSCRRCLDVCPTDAFPAPYQLDARRCLAYLSIEHKGHIPLAFRRPMANRVFGCDDCLAVCPWNKFAAAAADMRLKTQRGAAPPLADLLALDDAAFRCRFAGTPVKRTGRDRFLRNVLIAAGNSGDASLVPLISGLLADPAAIVRAMAVWALAELLDVQAFGALAQAHRPREPDPDVAREWLLGVAP